MIFGKHINVYYRKYALALLTGLLALFTVDYLQLKVPEIYQLVINGLNQGYIVENGVQVPFDMAFLLDRICMPMVGIILAIVFGRFLWRVTIFGAATKVETDLRDKMFRHAEDLSREYYQVNKVGNLMSLFTNDLDTVQECYGWGFMQFFDPIILCSLAITRMWRMDHLLTVLSLIPMGLLFASAAVVGKNMTRKWDYRQKCFSDLSDFAQESFSGIAVIKAFVKEAKELMALCVYRDGRPVSIHEIVENLWGENADGTGYRRTIKELADTLRDYGAEEMFLRSRGSLRVRMDLADSDFQAFMSGDEDAICQFQGVFMQQYSWAEPMVCTLQEKKELMLARMGKHRM